MTLTTRTRWILFALAACGTALTVAGCAGDASPASRDGGGGDAAISGSDGGDPGAADGGGPVTGPDTQDPYPIDRGGDGDGAPGSYKGLPLRLADRGEPTVTPVRGLIGVVCIGMSNATQECSDYIAKVEGAFASEINPQVRVVDCAQGGQAIEAWNDPGKEAQLWGSCIEDRIGAAGLDLDQVRVVYHKAANKNTGLPGGDVRPAYPDPDSDYFVFRDNLDTFSHLVKQHFPSAQAVYTTSRSCGAFADGEFRGEPLSYEEGHALNTWLDGDPSADGLWFGWGPYIWAPDCASGITNASDVCYVRPDFVDDGVHPAAGAKDKISGMIHARFSQHAWYGP